MLVIGRVSNIICFFCGIFVQKQCSVTVSFKTTFSFGGLILKYYFVGFSGKIGKEVEYVIHGVEEMSSHVISKLRKAPRKAEKSTVETDFEDANILKWVSIQRLYYSPYNKLILTGQYNHQQSNYLFIKTETDRDHFKMFDKYMNTRGRRIWLVLHIFMSRVTCIALSIQACIYLHSFYIKVEIFVAA